MKSATEKFNQVSQIADTADAYAGMFGLFSLGVVGITRRFKDSPMVADGFFDFTACYGITRGCLQIIEGIGMLGSGWAQELPKKNPKILASVAQIIGGFSAVIAGLCYEFAGTSLSYLFLGLGVSTIAKIAKNISYLKRLDDDLGFEDDREYGFADLYIAPWATLFEGTSLLAMAINPLSASIQIIWSICNCLLGAVVYSTLSFERTYAWNYDGPPLYSL